MAPRNRRRLNLRVADESRGAPERILPAAPQAGDRIGAFLRAWREHRGWTIDQVAWVLRIRLVYLEAIEEDRLDELPGRIYITGFVRSYAKLLGIDEEATVRSLRREHADLGTQRALVFPEPPSERAVPGGAIMAVGIIVAIMVYAGWYYQTATSRSERGTSVPAGPVATAELSSTGSGEADRYDLPPAMPMQPPMRPPPTRTVASNSASSLPDAPPSEAGHSGARPDSLSVSAPSAPASTTAPGTVAPTAVAPTAVAPTTVAPTTVASSAPRRSDEGGRGLPPDAGRARSVEIAVAEIGTPPSDGRARQEPPAASSPARPHVALSRTGEQAAASNEVGQTRGRGGAGPAPPRLPTAAMADAFASSLPAEMIPIMRDGPELHAQTMQSASAAWAGSVDRMPAGRWMQADSASGPVVLPVVLNAIEASWIEVRDEGGQVVTGKLLQPGDSYTVPPREGLTLTTGNAGGLEVLVGGTTAPSLGPRGAVRRGISLDGEQLLAGVAGRN